MVSIQVAKPYDQQHVVGFQAQTVPGWGPWRSAGSAPSARGVLEEGLFGEVGCS